MSRQAFAHCFIRFSFLRFRFQRRAAAQQPQNGRSFEARRARALAASRASARVERDAERRLEGAGPRPRMVVAGHQQRTRLDDDVRRRTPAARRCARWRSTSRRGRELLNVEVFRLSNANLKNPKNSHASPDADRRGRSRVRALRRRRHRRARRRVRRDRLGEEISVCVAARQRRIAGAPRGSADFQRRRPLRGVGHRARQAHGRA